MLSTMETRLEELTVSCEEMRRQGSGLENAVAEARERLEKETAEQDRLSATLQEARAGLEAADAEVIEARAAYDRKLAEMRDMESRMNPAEPPICCL